MKKISLVLSMSCLGLLMSAQPGVISTRPANDQNGKTLTMEETILSKELAPANLYSKWYSSDEIVMHKDGKWQVFNIKTQTYTDFDSKKQPRMVVGSKNGTLRIRYKDGRKTVVA